jgi:hypothetical protein
MLLLILLCVERRYDVENSINIVLVKWRLQWDKAACAIKSSVVPKIWWTEWGTCEKLGPVPSFKRESDLSEGNNTCRAVNDRKCVKNTQISFFAESLNVTELPAQWKYFISSNYYSTNRR